MGRSGTTKNGKKKWGFKMEELATMVERAQLEKIEFNKKKNKKAGKLSKKEYAEALAEEASETFSPKTNAKRKGKERGSDERKGKGKGYSMSTSCPSPTVGYFPSNKGRSISFTGGPNFSYTQFHYTYSCEDNSGKVQTSSTTATTSITMTTTATTSSFSYGSIPPEVTPSSSAPSSSFIPPMHLIDVEINESEEEGDSSCGSGEDDMSDLEGSLGIPDGFELDSFIQGTCLRFDGEEFNKSGSGIPDDGENEFMSSEEEENSTEESSQDSTSEDSENEGYSFISVTSGTFTHPNEDTENALDVAYEKTLQHEDSDDSDSLESAFGRRKRLKRLERDQKLQSSIPAHGFAYSTPQHSRGGQQERTEGPHSWPKKSNMPGKSRGGYEDDLRKGKKHKTRDKKKVQVKSKYVKYYVSSTGAPTAARGWVVGGTVKDDDLLHKLADISEPIEKLDKVVPPILEPSHAFVQNETSNDNDTEFPEEPELTPTSSFTKSNRKEHSASKSRGNAEIDEQLVMTPKEQKVYEAILAGNFNSFDSGKTKKEKKTKSKDKGKSARYPSFDVLELAKLMGDCNDFVQNSDRSMPLYPMTKEQRIQIYSLASLYNFKKESIGKGGNRSPVLSKNKKTAIPHCKVLAQFLRDCVETPKSLKTLYLDLDENGAPPPAVLQAAKWDREREREALGSPSGGRGERAARFVGENANPVGHDNVGNRMLRGMGWSGGGLGARGGGITEPIAQKIKFSRSGLG